MRKQCDRCTEIYIETWDNFEYMEDWQQKLISCIVVLQKDVNYPDPNRMDEFQDYFFDHKENAVPADKFIMDWTDEEMKDGPVMKITEKFIKGTQEFWIIINLEYWNVNILAAFHMKIVLMTLWIMTNTGQILLITLDHI